MTRVSTTTKKLPRPALHEVALESIRDSGWNVKLLGSVSSSPLRILIADDGQKDKLVIYIWNISHGGKTRSKDEYRIQLKKGPLAVGKSFKTLLLGWFEDLGVFAAFDAYKHRRFGRSPSVQVKKDALEQAVKSGIGFQAKKTRGGEGEEVVVAFQPDYIVEYIRDIYPQYHGGEIKKIPASEVRVIEKPLDPAIPLKELARVPEKRRTAVITMTKKIREANFKLNLHKLYAGKCVMCGLQAQLTEAAHIIPVGEKGTDEVTNGILLCRNHHKAFDSGLLAINDDYVIILNKKKMRWLLDNSQADKLKEFIKRSRIGEKIILPTDRRFYPKKKYLRRSYKSKLELF